jgi:hypothetical protein
MLLFVRYVEEQGCLCCRCICSSGSAVQVGAVSLSTHWRIAEARAALTPYVVSCTRYIHQTLLKILVYMLHHSWYLASQLHTRHLVQKAQPKEPVLKINSVQGCLQHIHIQFARRSARPGHAVLKVGILMADGQESSPSNILVKILRSCWCEEGASLSAMVPSGVASTAKALATQFSSTEGQLGLPLRSGEWGSMRLVAAHARHALCTRCHGTARTGWGASANTGSNSKCRESEGFNFLGLVSCVTSQHCMCQVL